MTKEVDFETLDTILGFTKIRKPEVIIMEGFIKEHIDPRCNLCKKGCRTEWQFALRRIKAFNKGLKR